MRREETDLRRREVAVNELETKVGYLTNVEELLQLA